MTRDYSTYQLDDFLEDDSFRRWALSEPSPDYDFWENYRAGHAAQANLMDMARLLILDLKASQQGPEDQVAAEHIWSRIRKEVESGPKVVPLMPKLLRIAASVAVLLTCWFGYKVLRSDGISGKITSQAEMVIEKNSGKEVKKVMLADGSTVSLQPNSILRYDKAFNELTRTVYLEGEAFFDIARNPEKPFLVFSHEVVTKVLGTSFTVKAYDGEADVTVSVSTGKVSVQSKEEFDESRNQTNSTLSGLVLTPNQKAIFLKKDDQLKKTLVEQPVLLTANATVSYDFNFENKPVNEVFDLLSKAYGVEIIYDEEVFKDCSLTVGMEDESLFEKLKIICKTINASYQVIDTKVLISGKGCKF